MKKAIVLSVLGIAASGLGAFGQGVIQFGNYTSTSYEPVYYNPNPAFAPAGLAGANVNNTAVDLQIYYMLGDQSADTLNTFLSVATAGATTSITPGTNPAGTYKGNPAPTGAIGGAGGYFTLATQTIAGWSSGSVTFAIIAWDSTGGATYATSLLTGSSGLWVDNGSDIVTVASGSSPNIADNPAIMMSTVPEPATMALGGLGLAALIAFRRKKV